MEDLQTALEQVDRGEPIRLPTKTTSFKDWSEQLTAYARSEALREERAYWLSQPSQFAALPVDFPDGVNTEGSTQVISTSLEVDETQTLLHEFPKAYRVQVNEVLLAALVESFAELSNTSGLLVDLEGHGREEIINGVELWRTIGWFTSIFPVWIERKEITDRAQFLKSVKEQLRRIPNRGIGYGLLRYLSMDQETAATLQALPQPQISFLYLGQFDQTSNETPLFITAGESTGASRSPRAMRRHVLDVYAHISHGRLQVDWKYSENLHRRATIERLADSFVRALRTTIGHCLTSKSAFYSPSDFPGAHINQDELDKIIAQVSQSSKLW